LKIFANHAHIFGKDIKQNAFQDGTIAALKRMTDDCGIDKCVCFAQFFEWGSPYDTNEYLYNEIKNKEEFVGFGVIDFRNKDFAGQVKKINDFGFKGIKLHPAMQHFKVDSPELFNVYAKAEELGLFISFHTGVHNGRLQNERLILFDEIAYHFPKLKFSLEHIGGYSFFNEALAVITNNPGRVYAGLTSVFDSEINRLWYLDDKKINDLIHLAGDDMCIFGLDFPWNSTEKIKEAIAHIQQMNLSEAAKEKILGGNLKNILN
jgi:predicted TIM-barrel fold metal-dependent hydrolase